MVYLQVPGPSLPEQWWDRVAAGFTQTAVPSVSVTELLAVVLIAAMLSVPRA